MQEQANDNNGARLTSERASHVAPLQVFKASAGSGKTYRLALEYVKLLAQNPNAYDSILAVTFTNKAAAEMKQRILSSLYGIVYRTTEAESFCLDVVLQTGLDKNTVEKRCSQALNNILHDYSRFRVGTIDSFFQQILMGLAHELGLKTNLRVEISDGELEREAVDKMVASLVPGQEQLRWIIEQIEHNMDDDRAWNVMPSLEHFSRHLSDNEFKDRRKELKSLFEDGQFFDSYASEMHKIINSFEHTTDALIAEFEKIADECGVDLAEFSYGSCFKTQIRNLRERKFDKAMPNATLQKRYDDKSSWVKKAKGSDPLGALKEAVEYLHPVFVRLEDHIVKASMHYFSAKATLRDFDSLRLLCAIDSYMHEQNADEGKFMLSDTGHFLHSFIEGSDTPFVYEKIGTRIKHIMIDEFQDTSTVQWNNFKVLLDDCISTQGNSALIVGDVKQSIYRWRSGDWRLLNNMEQYFKAGIVETTPLKKNYRSRRNIITFNNNFFRIAADNAIKKYGEKAGDTDSPSRHSEQYTKAYADVKQEYSDKTKDGGEVRVELIDTKTTTMGEQLIATVSYLVDECKAKPSSIAVLVRGNKEISQLALYCKQQRPDIDFVSSEAFCLGQSVAVNLIMSSLSYLANPDDMLARATTVSLWHQMQGSKATTAQLARDSNSTDALPDGFNMELSTRPLYQLIESLCKIFEVEKAEGEQLYVAALLDYVASFIAENSSDIEKLIAEWNRDGGLSSKSIPSTTINGVQFLTIHKSKGLEFDNVIVPYCDWQTSIKTSPAPLKWLSPKQSPYDRMPVLPITMRKDLQYSIFADEYDEEMFQTSVDNMNLLYVAFTRSVCNLYVIASAHNNKEGYLSKTLAEVIPAMAESMNDAIIDQSTCSDGKTPTMEFRYGQYVSSSHSERQTDNPFTQKENPLPINLKVNEMYPSFVESKKSRELFDRPYIAASEGIALHAIFENVRVITDFDIELERAQNSGMLDGLRVTADDIAQLVKPQFNDKQIASWFAPDLEIFSEHDILIPDAPIQRPDRVVTDGKRIIVVDYKFGEIEMPKYKQQVLSYAKLLQQMGYNDIEAYLWYVSKRKVERLNGLDS